MTIKDIGPSYRKEDEKYDDYKQRLKEENKFVKNYLRGTNIWNASTHSTYRKPKDV